MIGVKDPRDRLHHGGWMVKVVSWCLTVNFMFFLPNGYHQLLWYIALFVVSLSATRSESAVSKLLQKNTTLGSMSPVIGTQNQAAGAGQSILITSHGLAWVQFVLFAKDTCRPHGMALMKHHHSAYTL
ncbi:hypothetical protein MKW98_002993 [Papaver atlanticum]|uniref:Uncharacterized protein n=1 Tax=Papaver atlanticum TaxID=357466 RepID=A0AAD4THH8_9MAGN|nr:hypothetical protein MKW98_002993 [Papaver atlanticum]